MMMCLCMHNRSCNSMATRYRQNVERGQHSSRCHGKWCTSRDRSCGLYSYSGKPPLPLSSYSCPALLISSPSIPPSLSYTQDVLTKTGVKPKDIDILIINCSLFSPTPSLCAMVAHHFKMRSDVLSYNLSGMGCSAGLVSIDLAKRLLESRPRSRALVVSTENLTQAFYHGNDRAFLLQNTLFRCGGAAMLLSNRVPDGLKAKYKLLHLVRTQGNDDQSYEAVFSTQDEKGEKGVRLSKEIVKVAGKLMERNLTTIG